MAEEQETEALVTETKKGRKRTANNYEQLTSLDCYTEGYNETSNNNKNKSRPLLFHYWKLYILMHTHEYNPNRDLMWECGRQFMKT